MLNVLIELGGESASTTRTVTTELIMSEESVSFMMAVYTAGTNSGGLSFLSRTVTVTKVSSHRGTTALSQTRTVNTYTIVSS